MEALIATAGFAVLAIVALLAVLHPAYDDTFAQRVGLALVCVAATACAWWSWRADHIPDQVAMLATALGVFAAASVPKVITSKESP